MTTPSDPGGRVLGVDPGDRRIGLALSDPGRVIATPLEVIDLRGTDPVDRIREVCAEHEVAVVVIGLPIGLGGTEGAAAAAARELGTVLASSIGCDVVYWDERFTTVTAEAALIQGGVRREQRRNRRDMVAAAVMLQSYLDHLRATIDDEHQHD